MNSFTEKSARDVCVFVCVCVCRMYAHTIIILKTRLICSFSSIRDFETIFKKERQKIRERQKRQKKQTFSSNKNAIDDVETTTVASSSSLPLLVLFPHPRFFPFSSIVFKRAGRGGKMSSGHCENRFERVRKRLW